MNEQKPLPSRKSVGVMVVLSGLIVTFCGASLYYWLRQRSIEQSYAAISRAFTPEEIRELNSRIDRPFHQIGSPKIRIEGNHQYLWAGGSMIPGVKGSRWFDMTGSPLPLKSFQFGIGRDRIPSIDSPVFVKPEDPRLKKYWAWWGIKNIGDLEVIGFAYQGDARAYPKMLLNNRELVNDTVGGKPVTVGW